MTDKVRVKSTVLKSKSLYHLDWLGILINQANPFFYSMHYNWHHGWKGTYYFYLFNKTLLWKSPHHPFKVIIGADSVHLCVFAVPATCRLTNHLPPVHTDIRAPSKSNEPHHSRHLFDETMLVSIACSELASVKLSKLQMIVCSFLASYGGVCNQFNNYPILSIELKKQNIWQDPHCSTRAC